MKNREGYFQLDILGYKSSRETINSIVYIFKHTAKNPVIEPCVCSIYTPDVVNSTMKRQYGALKRAFPVDTPEEEIEAWFQEEFRSITEKKVIATKKRLKYLNERLSMKVSF